MRTTFHVIKTVITPATKYAPESTVHDDVGHVNVANLLDMEEDKELLAKTGTRERGLQIAGVLNYTSAVAKVVGAAEPTSVTVIPRAGGNDIEITLNGDRGITFKYEFKLLHKMQSKCLHIK